jgi:hypothetical protein
MKFPAGLAAIFLCFVIFSPAVSAIDKETRWADPSKVDLSVEFPGDGYHADWDLFRCDCGDLMVTSELSVPEETVKGDLVLVEGRAVLSRGFDNYQDEAAASLDAAALMMQLTLRLLERSEPAGPSAINTERDIEVEDSLNHINLDTGTAVGGFRAPWSISGKIVPAGETQRRFDLQFSFTVGAPGGVQETSMRLKGLADFADTEFPIGSSDSLEGWKLDWRNPDDGAAAMASEAKTLDQLRALIRKTP